ncbi:unnamed protein product [Nyctereutes procyonoides]|uniref:(raccoon dog) hypothetical protein n=1 Tax=Nyctereutes procyonoides TaxID=34880 RepID=A0A811Y7B7_NYCPR|nr:unnamed protein product [Nyctereutes procyonoides]
MMPTPVILLKEGTDSSQGIPQLVSNISACQVIAEAVRTTLGPRGIDKLIVDGRGKATISNDGATILKLLDVVHPAAKTLVDIAKSQDAEVGDGTTSVTLLAAEFLKQVKPYVEEVNKIKEIAVTVKKEDKVEQRKLLEKCAMTALSSKLISQQKAFFAKMVVDASQLVAGVAFKKTFSYAGFEMQPKKYNNPMIALLNVELELKAEKDNAEIRVHMVEDYQASNVALTDSVSGSQVLVLDLPKVLDVTLDKALAPHIPQQDMNRKIHYLPAEQAGREVVLEKKQDIVSLCRQWFRIKTFTHRHICQTFGALDTLERTEMSLKCKILRDYPIYYRMKNISGLYPLGGICIPTTSCDNQNISRHCPSINCILQYTKCFICTFNLWAGRGRGRGAEGGGGGRLSEQESISTKY